MTIYQNASEKENPKIGFKQNVTFEVFVSVFDEV